MHAATLFLMTYLNLSRITVFFCLALAVLWSKAAYCQKTQATASSATIHPVFVELMQRLPRNWHGDSLLPPPVIFRDSTYGRPRELQYDVQLSERPLGLRHQVVQLGNPYNNQKLPLSYSVVYRKCLVALFAPGSFACFRLTDFSRNTELEQQLNTQKFEQHWSLNQQLIALRQGQAYRYDTAQVVWLRYTGPLPFAERTKVFEDERFMATMDCHGEFGGHLYFFDKQTKQTHYTTATCATAVWKENGNYHVLASLDHMFGSAGSGIIPAPEKLPRFPTSLKAAQDWQYSFPTSKPNPAVQRVFRYHGITMLGGFRWHNQTLYLLQWHHATLLATVAGKHITVVDPLFSNSLKSSQAITTEYGPNLILTTLPQYKARQYLETGCLLLYNKDVINVEWHEPCRD